MNKEKQDRMTIKKVLQLELLIVIGSLIVSSFVMLLPLTTILSLVMWHIGVWLFSFLFLNYVAIITWKRDTVKVI